MKKLGKGHLTGFLMETHLEEPESAVGLEGGNSREEDQKQGRKKHRLSQIDQGGEVLVGERGEKKKKFWVGGTESPSRAKKKKHSSPGGHIRWEGEKRGGRKETGN